MLQSEHFEIIDFFKQYKMSITLKLGSLELI